MPSYLHFRRFRGRGPLRLQPYTDGREADITAFWNAAHDRLAGFIPRSVPFWRWSILERPGVTPPDILLVEDRNGRICAYGAIEMTGNVLDFVVDPELPSSLARDATRVLVEGLEDRALLHGAPAITLGIPESAAVPARHLSRSGFRPAEDRFMTLSIEDAAGLLRKILEDRGDELAAFVQERVRVCLPNGGAEPGSDGSESRVCVEWVVTDDGGRGQVEVAEHDCGFDPTLEIILDRAALTDLVFRRASVKELEAEGRLRYAPAGAARFASSFLDLLVLRTPWHLPTADIL